MIIYQAQPNRAYPSMLTYLKNDGDPLSYEFSTQFNFSNLEDHNYMYSNNLIQYSYKERPARNINDETFNPICLRLKNKSQLDLLDKTKDFDYFYGIYDQDYLIKNPNDFSFTMIDHPINQVLNIFYYIKYQINSEEEINEYKFLLNLEKQNLNKELEKHKIDVENFKIEDLHEDAFDFSLTKDFYLKYYNHIDKEEVIKRFQDFYSKYFVYMLICSTSFERFSSQEEWIDYFLSNPDLKDFINYQNMKFTYPKSFIRASALSKDHDFYGIIDSRKNCIKSLHLVSEKTNMLFALNSNYNSYSPMDGFSYKRKELEKLLEEDIAFFFKKKEALNNL